MNAYTAIFAALLFIALTPGVLLSIPPGGSKLAVAATHGIVFAIVYHFTNRAVMDATEFM